MSVAGKLVYHIYYKPIAFIKYAGKFGGIRNYQAILTGKKNMARAAGSLPVLPVQQPIAEIYFLTGKKYWALTAFCVYSLRKASQVTLRPVFIDDGTVDARFIKNARKLFPDCLVKTAAETDAIIGEKLPASKYPCLNRKRNSYPHIKKLIDVHIISPGWKMVLDSDMLFFKEPAEMIKWLKDPQQPFFLEESAYGYHYSLALMEKLAGKKIRPQLNVGVIGLKSEAINWDTLENWIKTLEAQEGENYLLEQALSAMLVAGEEIIVADKNDYIVMPCQAEIETPAAVMHHYVDLSKEWYYKRRWKTI